MHDRDAHAKPIERLAGDLQTDLARGLGSAQAQARLQSAGPNELAERPRPGFWKLLGAQFNNYLVLILLAAALVSLLLGEVVDSVAIAVIVLLNAVVGVIQESKAEQALAALKKMAAPLAQVVRDGHQQAVPGRELVPGDLVLLEAGNFVPADLRLVEAHNLRIEEASLTGESVPVAKDASALFDGEVPLGDRSNAAFMGTVVTAGRGRGIVACTGMNTQIGLIAQMIQSFEDEATPLQRKLAQLGRVLGTACLAICVVVFAWGLLRDTRIGDIASLGLAGYLGAERQQIVALFMTAVSLAIAAVPEGLPAIVTVCLALGMQRMIRHHALIRRLPAVETLGCATVICSDKTGTLTQNRMTVVQAWAGGRAIRLVAGADARAGFVEADTAVDPGVDPDLSALLQGAAACNDAHVESGDGTVIAVGDPTEAALVMAAYQGGVRQEDLAARLPRVLEIPFDADRKRMATLHRREPAAAAAGFEFPPLVALVKGAPDLVLELCTHALQGGRMVPLDAALRAEAAAGNRAMAAQALRVLAVAYRPLDALPAAPEAADIERELVFVGLLGMIDPPRPEAVEAIAVARGAGLRTVMVTGDHRDTAEAIARDIGLRTPGGLVLTGAEIDRLSDAELAAQVERLEVCCRVSPQHKTRIVDAFKSRGHVVAMTGDGVNDAPALKRANIGVAMGVTGTDVAKQTADMVLTDDNFASIVAAIEQGRVIYSNIRKFVYFLLACNVGEILIVFGAMLVGLPMPLRPVQLLWLNLVSDGAPALALGLEKGDPDIMKQPARASDEPVIDRSMALGIATVGVVDMLAVLAVFHLALQRHPGHVEAAQTIAFVTLCCSELLRAFCARSETRSVWRVGLAGNPWMMVAVAVSFALVLAVVYVPFLAPFFDAVPPTADDWLLMLPFFFASPLAMEAAKVFARRGALRAPQPSRPGPAEGPDPFPPANPDGEPTMKRVLLPVAGNANDRFAVQEVVRRFLNTPALEVHVINVQAPFPSDVAHFTSRRARAGHHRERAELALAPVRQALDRYGVPHAVHVEVGDRAATIAEAARRLGCDEIVMASARKNSLTRLVESSVTGRVLELSPVPVEVVPGDAMSKWERFGIPAAIGTALALALAAAD